MAIPAIESYSLEEAARLPQNKVDWVPDARRAVLLIHDMQNYFVDFYNREQPLAQRLLDRIKTLKALCRARDIPVVYTAQPPDQKPRERALLSDFWGPGLQGGTDRSDIVDVIAPTGQDTQMTKWRYSAFQRTGLQDFMQTRERDQLIICGVYAHIGILATSLEAFMIDIKPFVVADAVADFSLADQRMALNYIAQRCGFVTDIDGLRQAFGEGRTAPLTLGKIHADAAAILTLTTQDFSVDDNLLYVGMDSVRVMSLVETWRAAGADLNFMDLAGGTTLREWWNIIETHSTIEAAKKEGRLPEPAHD